MPQKRFWLLPLIAVVSGCTNLNLLARDEQRLRIEVATPAASSHLQKPGAVYVWPPYASAAIVGSDGSRCVLTAAGAKTYDASADANLITADVMEQIGKLEADTQNTLKTLFTRLSAADSRAAFLDVALFHLCVLDQNGTFKGMQDQDQLAPEKRAHPRNMGKARPILDAYREVVREAARLAQSPGAHAKPEARPDSQDHAKPAAK